MKDIDVKELIEKVETIAVDQKVVERKAFWDYLLDKREKGQYKKAIITFDDEEDYAIFEKLSGNLGIDVRIIVDSISS